MVPAPAAYFAITLRFLDYEMPFMVTQGIGVRVLRFLGALVLGCGFSGSWVQGARVGPIRL